MTAIRTLVSLLVLAPLGSVAACSSDGTCVDPIGGTVTLAATPATSCLSLRATMRASDILIEGANGCTVPIAIYPVRTDGGRDVLSTYRPGDEISYPTPKATKELTFFYGSETRTLAVSPSAPTASNCN